MTFCCCFQIPPCPDQVAHNQCAMSAPVWCIVPGDFALTVLRLAKLLKHLLAGLCVLQPGQLSCAAKFASQALLQIDLTANQPCLMVDMLLLLPADSKSFPSQMGRTVTSTMVPGGLGTGPTPWRRPTLASKLSCAGFLALLRSHVRATARMNGHTTQSAHSACKLCQSCLCMTLMCFTVTVLLEHKRTLLLLWRNDMHVSIAVACTQNAW